MEKKFKVSDLLKLGFNKIGSEDVSMQFLSSKLSYYASCDQFVLEDKMSGQVFLEDVTTMGQLYSIISVLTPKPIEQ